MPTLWLDTETWNEHPIQNGTHRYAETAEVMLFAYALDDEPVSVWDLTAGTLMPAALASALRNPDVLLVAHNAAFDRTVLRHALGIDQPITRWRCTMAQAYAHSLPGGLDQLCSVLGVPQDLAKHKVGKELVQLFCKPRPKNQKLRRATRATHPQEWAQFVAYAGGDIDAMRAVMARLPTWNYKGEHLALWHLDQTINDRGILVDLDLATKAMDAAAREKALLAERAHALTEGELQATTQRDALLRHLLEQYGVDLPDTQSGTLERRLDDPDLPAPVRELIENRLAASSASVAKYKKFVACASSDGRLRGTLQYCGAARTGRWAGRLVQLQNLPRPSHKQAQIDQAIELIKADVLDAAVPDVMPMLASCIRGTLLAAPGRRLVVADLSNIEGRMLAWLAGEAWKLDAFRAFDAGTGPDLYVAAYAKSFGVSVEAVLENKAKGDGMMRQIGKVQELALGFQGSVGAFGSMAAIYGVNLPEQEILRVVKAWREAHPAVVSYWWDIERAARDAISMPGTTITCRRHKLRRDGSWLRISLPSGRCLCYPSPRVDDEGKISYMGVNQYTRKWERLHTYGGKLVENLTQAAARDVMAHGMLLAERDGFEVLLTVHDELITEAPETFTADRLGQLMSTNPSWAPELPLAAAGFETYRYKKE
jgi:DNA polymerase